MLPVYNLTQQFVYYCVFTVYVVVFIIIKREKREKSSKNVTLEMGAFTLMFHTCYAGSPSENTFVKIEVEGENRQLAARDLN